MECRQVIRIHHAVELPNGPVWTSATSPSLYSFHSPIHICLISNHSQGFSESVLFSSDSSSICLFQLCLQRIKPFGKIEIILIIRQTDVSAGGQDIVQWLSLHPVSLICRSPTHLIFAFAGAPVVVGAGNQGNILIGQLSVSAVD